MLKLMRPPQDDEPENRPTDTPPANINTAATDKNGETHERGKSTFHRLFDSIESSLSNDEPFTYYITNESGELKSIGIIVAIQFLANRGEINPHQAIALREQAERAMRTASFAKNRKNKVSPANIRAQQGALALLELEFDNKVEPRLSAKENLLRAIQQDQTEIVTGSMDDYAAKPILITIFWERMKGTITPEDALELVEKFCKRLKETRGELGILDLASLYMETVGDEKLLTPTDMETMLRLAKVNEADIAILAPMFPEGMEIWKKAYPDLPNILLTDELSSPVEQQEAPTNTALLRQPGFLTKRRFVFATAALAVIAAAGAITRTSWEGSSSGENHPSIKISSLPPKEAMPQNPPIQTISKETRATKEHVAKTLHPKPEAMPIKIASPQPAPAPVPPKPIQNPAPASTPTQPAQAPIQPIPAPTSAPILAETAPALTVPISTKSGPIGPQFDEAGSIKQWEVAGWTVKISLRPGGKKSYTLTKDGQTLRIINPKVTAGQTAMEAERVQ